MKNIERLAIRVMIILDRYDLLLPLDRLNHQGKNVRWKWFCHTADKIWLGDLE